MASASDWSRPNGPCTLGPGRTCMRATTLRSNQMAMSTLVSRNTTMATALISQIHHVSLLKSAVDGGDGLGRQEASCAGLQVVADRRARRTRSPASACRASRTPAPTAFVGSHTTWSGMSVTHRGQRERARVGGHASGCRRPARRPPRPCRRRCGRRAAWRCRRGTARRTAGDPRRAAGARWPARPCPAGTAGGSAAGTSGAPTRAPSQPPSWSSSACTALERLQPQLDARGRRRAGRARGGRPSRARRAPAGTGAGAPPT